MKEGAELDWIWYGAGVLVGGKMRFWFGGGKG